MIIPASSHGAGPVQRGQADSFQGSAPRVEDPHVRDARSGPRADRVDVHAGDGGRGLSPEERLARLAERFDGRLERLLQSENLSDEQRAALEQVRAEFGSLVDRLSRALDSLQPETIARAFQSIRGDMVAAARDIVAPDEVPQPVPGPAAGASGARAGGVGTVPGDEVPPPGGPSLEERLDAAQSQVDRRFERFLARADLDPEQRAALEAAHQHFSTMLEGLREAFASGEHDARFLRSGFNAALAGLGEAAASVFGEDFYGRPDSGGSVGLYDARGGIVEGGPSVSFTKLA